MGLLNFASVKLCGCLILGILVGYYFDFTITVSIIIIGVLLLLLIWSYLKQSRKGFPLFGVLTLLSVVAMGIFVTTMAQPDKWPTHYSKVNQAAGNTYRLKITEVLKPTAFSQRYYAEVKSVDDNSATGKLLISQGLDSTKKTTLKTDDEILIFDNPIPLGGPMNPHQFDYRDYLKKQGVYHQVRLQKGNFYKPKNTPSTVFGFANNLRQKIISRLKKEKFGQVELSIIQALILGQRNDISEETYNNYKNAGAVHILAVSGLHIGILLLLLQFLLKPLEVLPKGKTVKLISIVLLLWGYALLAGLSPSIVRAVTMFSFLAYAMHLNRPVNTFNILALSMFFILLIEPLFLFQVGFQMSYAAVFAIIWIYPKMQRFWLPNSIFVKKIWQLFSVGIAAQLGVLPISLFYFHQFPALFFISNLVIVPFLGLILGVGIVIIVLALLNSLPNLFVECYDILIGAMNTLIDRIARQEAFVFKDISFDTVQLILWYIIIVAAVSALSKPKFKKVEVILLGIVLLQSWALINQLKTGTKNQVVLVHQITNTLLLNQKSAMLHVIGSKDKASSRIVRDFAVGENIDSIVYSDIENAYEFNNTKLYIIDSTALYPSMKALDYVLLRQSPKINLDRLFDSVKPKLVLADGSNYTSDVTRWKISCYDKKIPFHYTGEKGAYYFKME